jgi:hypothetical protein
MNISSSYMMVINLTQPITNKNYIKIVTDSQLYANVESCTGYYCDPLTKKILKVGPLSCTQNGTGSNKMDLTITDKLGNKINISSL